MWHVDAYVHTFVALTHRVARLCLPLSRTCPSAKSGGALGTFGPGQMVPAFDKVCWSAPVGSVQGPVQTQFGYLLILVTERSEDEAKTKAK